jgi:hypothetical protein
MEIIATLVWSVIIRVYTRDANQTIKCVEQLQARHSKFQIGVYLILGPSDRDYIDALTCLGSEVCQGNGPT